MRVGDHGWITRQRGRGNQPGGAERGTRASLSLLLPSERGTSTREHSIGPGRAAWIEFSEPEAQKERVVPPSREGLALKSDIIRAAFRQESLQRRGIHQVGFLDLEKRLRAAQIDVPACHPTPFQCDHSGRPLPGDETDGVNGRLRSAKAESVHLEQQCQSEGRCNGQPAPGRLARPPRRHAW